MSLLAPILIAALAAGPAAKPDPKSLVARLGSADPGERAEAVAALKALGASALPALHEAGRGGDRALVGRASALWDEIGRESMTRPSLVRFDVEERPLADVIADLGAQTGLALREGQGPSPGLLTIRDPDPIPFWQAIERLGLNGVAHQNEGRGGYPRLLLSKGPATKFLSTTGPFRIALTGLHLHRDHQLIHGPWVRIDRIGQRIRVGLEGENRDRGRGRGGEDTAFFGNLSLMVEPRMWFTQEAPARLVEASDDLGQSLVPEAAGGGGWFSSGGHFAFAAGRGVTEALSEFRLRAPERPGRVARLRGVVPVMLHLRRPDPTLVIPLADAAGKTFPCGDAELTINAVDHTARGTIVSTIVRLDVADADLPEDPDPELMMARLQMLGAHQFQLTDDAGTVLADGAGGGSGGGRTPAVYRWNFNTFGRGRATHLRYYGMLRARFDAAFDFRDVPLP